MCKETNKMLRTQGRGGGTVTAPLSWGLRSSAAVHTPKSVITCPDFLGREGAHGVEKAQKQGICLRLDNRVIGQAF